MASHSKHQQNRTLLAPVQLDMFESGPLIPILEPINLPSDFRLIACAVCREPFKIQRCNGRPKKFCSDVCRTTQHQQQIAEWHATRRQRKACDSGLSTAQENSACCESANHLGIELSSSDAGQCDAGFHRNRDTFDALRDAEAKAENPDGISGIALICRGDDDHSS